MALPDVLTLIQIAKLLCGKDHNDEKLPSLTSEEEVECGETLLSFILGYENYGLRVFNDGISNVGQEGFDHFFRITEETRKDRLFKLENTTVTRDDWLSFICFDPTNLKALVEDWPVPVHLKSGGRKIRQSGTKMYQTNLDAIKFIKNKYANNKIKSEMKKSFYRSSFTALIEKQRLNRD